MKKRLVIMVLTAAMAVSMMAGCSKKSENNTQEAAEVSTEASTEAVEAAKTYPDDAYLFGVTASDYVELPDYSKIEVEMTDPRESINDEYVESTIQSYVSASSQLQEVTDRDTVKSGDTVNIDYLGKKDGVAFDGGTAEGYDLTIGSGSFIDGFEDGVIGMKVGEKKTLNLTFPENYGNADLAGQKVTFDVTVNKIQESVTPELNDEWVASQNIENVKTVAEYRTYMKDSLLEQAQSNYDSQLQGGALEWLTDNVTFKQEPPQDMLDRWYDTMVTAYTEQATAYGMEIDEFMKSMMSMYGYGEDVDWQSLLKDDAETLSKRYLALAAVAEAEKMEVTDEEYKTELSNQAQLAGYTDADTFEVTTGAKNLKEYILVTKVAEFLQGRATVVEPKETETETSAEAATEASTEAAE